MRKTTIVTECGHQYKTGYPAATLAACTTDCRVCGALLIFPYDVTGTCVRAEDFHKHLWRQGPQMIDGKEFRWPEDGAGTGYVGFTAN